MELELVPEQPPQIVEALAGLLEELDPARRRPPDPWWQAGIDDALDP